MTHIGAMGADRPEISTPRAARCPGGMGAEIESSDAAPSALPDAPAPPAAAEAHLPGLWSLEELVFGGSSDATAEAEAPAAERGAVAEAHYQREWDAFVERVRGAPAWRASTWTPWLTPEAWKRHFSRAVGQGGDGEFWRCRCGFAGELRRAASLVRSRNADSLAHYSLDEGVGGVLVLTVHEIDAAVLALEIGHGVVVPRSADGASWGVPFAVASVGTCFGAAFGLVRKQRAEPLSAAQVAALRDACDVEVSARLGGCVMKHGLDSEGLCSLGDVGRACIKSSSAGEEDPHVARVRSNSACGAGFAACVGGAVLFPSETVMTQTYYADTPRDEDRVALPDVVELHRALDERFAPAKAVTAAA